MVPPPDEHLEVSRVPCPTTADKKIPLRPYEDLWDDHAQPLYIFPEAKFRIQNRPSDRGEIEAAYGIRKRIHVEVLSKETCGIWNREEPSTTRGLAESAEPLLGDANRFHHFGQKLDCCDEILADTVGVENVGNFAQESDSVRCLLRLCVKHGKSALGRNNEFEQAEVREDRSHGAGNVAGVLEGAPDTLLK